MRKTECELNASFGLIRVFASAARNTGTLLQGCPAANFRGRRAVNQRCRVTGNQDRTGCGRVSRDSVVRCKKSGTDLRENRA
jgi:hypothetical protein